MMTKTWKKSHRERFKKRHCRFKSKIQLYFKNLEEKQKFVGLIDSISRKNKISYIKTFNLLLLEFLTSGDNKKNTFESGECVVETDKFLGKIK